MKLLVCIASHNPVERSQYLFPVINNLKSYKLDTHIIIDVNKEIQIPGTETVIQRTLPHPYSLTWCHRQHMIDNIDRYDWFMYTEDDVLLPYENFLNYINNFNILWNKYIPSFIRVEVNNNEEYITDVTVPHSVKDIILYKGKKFINLSNPYHAFWILPKKALKEELSPKFNRLETWRELAASYPMWELKKIPLVEVHDNKISNLCYSYHLPNNYANFSNTPFAKIKVKDIIQ